MPAAVQILFAVRYVGDPDELDGETAHEIACRIYDPDGTQVGEQTARLSAGVEQHVPGYVAAIVVPTGIVLEIQRLGTYGVEFSIDDHDLRIPVHAVAPT